MTDDRTQPVVIGPAHESDLPAILELTCAAFGEQVRPRMRAMLWGDASLKLDDLRVARAGGEIVACVRIANRPIHYGAATLRMAGIGAVATHPDYQDRGYASLVLGDAAATMRTAGYQLGLLFTGIPAFYARLGWVSFPEHRTEWTIGAGQAAGHGPAAGARPFVEAADLPAVEWIYAEQNRERIGPLVRTPQHWRDDHSRVLGIMPTLVVEHTGDVVGYASLTSDPPNLFVNEAGYQVDESTVCNVLAAAIWHEAKERQATALIAHLPAGHGLIAALQALSPTLRREQTQFWMMLLLLDLPALLVAAAPELNRRLRMAGTTNELELGLRVSQQYARLIVWNRTVHLDSEPAARVLDIPAELFFRMFLGEQMAAVLREQLSVAGDALSDREVAMLDLLFPQRAPIYWRADHF